MEEVPLCEEHIDRTSHLDDGGELECVACGVERLRKALDIIDKPLSEALVALTPNQVRQKIIAAHQLLQRARDAAPAEE